MDTNAGGANYVDNDHGKMKDKTKFLFFKMKKLLKAECTVFFFKIEKSIAYIKPIFILRHKAVGSL